MATDPKAASPATPSKPGTTEAPPPKPPTQTYRFVGDRAVELELEDGTRPWLGPGDFIELSDVDADHDKTQYMINNNLLIEGVAASAGTT